MRMVVRGIAVGLGVMLAACGGGAGGGSALPQQGAAVSSDTRSIERAPAGVIYLAFSDHIDVYPKNASGSPSPIRTIIGLPPVSAIAVDRFGKLYVADGSAWTVRVFGPNANGAATPIHSYVGSYPATDGPNDRHHVAGIGVLGDGGIAALLESDPPGGVPGHLSFGVFDPNAGTLGIVEALRDGQGLGLAVDGLGDVFVGYGYDDKTALTRPIVVQRFGPDPVGFDDDGVILRHGQLDSGFHGFTIAASGDDLQVNAERYDGSAPGSPALVATITTAGLIRVPNVAFDAEGRLFAESVGVAFKSPTVYVFPKNLTSSTPPVRSFQAVFTDANPQPIGIAVTR